MRMLLPLRTKSSRIFRDRKIGFTTTRLLILSLLLSGSTAASAWGQVDDLRSSREALSPTDLLTFISDRRRLPFRDCPVCPEMIEIPAGSYLMGSLEGDTDERPLRKITVTRRFAVGRFEVTFAEWDACFAAGGCKRQPNDYGWGRGRRPVVDVAWSDIMREYLPWLSKRTGKNYRLPTEIEWEYAARAGTTTAYTWGATIGRGKANCDGCGAPWDGNETAPVGTFQPNAFGLFDMHGNVWEWTADCYRDDPVWIPTDDKTFTTGACALRVMRGGSWLSEPSELRSANRDRLHGDNRYSLAIGFRVSRTLP
jgi:formylglycine-generating enzyme required for sulfatase activity